MNACLYRFNEEKKKAAATANTRTETLLIYM